MTCVLLHCDLCENAWWDHVTYVYVITAGEDHVTGALIQTYVLSLQIREQQLNFKHNIAAVSNEVRRKSTFPTRFKLNYLPHSYSHTWPSHPHSSPSCTPTQMPSPPTLACSPPTPLRRNIVPSFSPLTQAIPLSLRSRLPANMQHW